MPIYEYACPECGHQNEHMQKLADAPIAACPKCGSGKYYKKISAAGFALKGTGWYVTDFRNGSGGGAKSAENKDSGDSKAADSAAPSAAPASAPAPAAAPAPAPASSASSGSGE